MALIMKKLEFILNDYFEAVYPNVELSPLQIETVKSSFVAGAKTMINLFYKLGDPRITEQEMAEAIKMYETEIDEFVAKRVRRQAERN